LTSDQASPNNKKTSNVAQDPAGRIRTRRQTGRNFRTLRSGKAQRLGVTDRTLPVTNKCTTDNKSVAQRS